MAVEGEVLVNGTPRRIKEFNSIASYVQQVRTRHNTPYPSPTAATPLSCLPRHTMLTPCAGL